MYHGGVKSVCPSHHLLTKDASWYLLVTQVAWMLGEAPGRLWKTSRSDHAYGSLKGIRLGVNWGMGNDDRVPRRAKARIRKYAACNVLRFLCAGQYRRGGVSNVSV